MPDKELIEDLKKLIISLREPIKAPGEFNAGAENGKTEAADAIEDIITKHAK